MSQKPTKEEQVAYTQSIVACAAECGLEGLKPEFYREMVCSLAGNKMVQGRKSAKISKTFPSNKSEQVKLFNEKVKQFGEDKCDKGCTLVDTISPYGLDYPAAASCNGQCGKNIPHEETIKHCKECKYDLCKNCKNYKGITIEVNSKMAAGDMYQTIEDVMPIDKDEKCSITHNQGEVLMIDFWATWCGPCQKPMAHNQEMLEKRAADWGGKVRIIGVSIDQTKAAMKSHIEEKKWTSVEHYHRHESNCSKTYSVQGVPHVMLIDTEGRLVFVGHPSTRPNLEEDFDTLLKGERLTGQGAWVEQVAEAEGGGDNLEEGFKTDCDVDAVHAQIDTFEAQAKEWLENEEVKGKCEGMQRVFCVMTFDEIVDSKTGKMAGKFQNHRVLAGPQDKIDGLKSFLDENVKGDFEIKLREDPM